MHDGEDGLGRTGAGGAVLPANGWARRALARTLERQSRAGEAVVHHRVADAVGAA